MFGDYYNPITDEWKTNPIYKEILKLDRMLVDANIPHTLKRRMDGWQICYPTDRGSPECIMDAIQHFRSYGNAADTIEIMGLLTPEEEEYDSVLGSLPAEDVFERIRKHYAGEWYQYIESLTANTSEKEPEDSFFIASITPMTPDEFADKMRDAYKVHYEEHDDEEVVHEIMDDVMCDLLRQLGYGEGIDIFVHTPKWYA